MKQYLAKIKEVYNQPVALADLHLELATHYATESDRLADLIDSITDRKRILKLEAKSISALQLDYELSEEGKEEKRIKIRLDGVEKLLASIRRRLETFDHQVKNEY